MVLVDLALSWTRVAVFGFGGGHAMVPLMKAECVDVNHWMSEEQFLDALAFGYTLPGPIAVKMSVYTGYQVGGSPGAVVSFLAVTLPSAALMLGLATLFLRLKDARWAVGAMAGVKPVVVGLLLWTVIDLAPGGVRSWAGGALALAAVLALALKVHPAIVVAAGLGIGALFMR